MKSKKHALEDTRRESWPPSRKPSKNHPTSPESWLLSGCAQHLLHFFKVGLLGLSLSVLAICLHFPLELPEGPDLHAIARSYLYSAWPEAPASTLFPIDTFRLKCVFPRIFRNCPTELYWIVEDEFIRTHKNKWNIFGWETRRYSALLVLLLEGALGRLTPTTLNIPARDGLFCISDGFEVSSVFSLKMNEKNTWDMYQKMLSI